MTRPRPSFEQLVDLDLSTLKSVWSKTFGSSFPARAKRELLIRLLAYGKQERTHGALPRAVQKSLQAMVPWSDGAAQSISMEERTPSLRLGARLIRSWNGAVHEVIVLDRGFAYRGKQYRSLSEIAQLITGAHWSGPRFFGLRKARSSTVASARASA